MEERLPKLRVDVKEMNRQSHHATKFRSAWRSGLSKGARCSTCRALVGGDPRAPRLHILDKIAQNPIKYGAKCDSRLSDGDGCEVKTANSHLTLRGQIWYNIRHTLGEGLEIGVLKAGYDQICEATN